MKYEVYETPERFVRILFRYMPRMNPEREFWSVYLGDKQEGYHGLHSRVDAMAAGELITNDKN